MANRLARHSRTNATPAERKLWRQLRLLKHHGHHFRRQVPIGPWIADFADYGSRLIIEVDGGGHTEEGDAARTRDLELRGFLILRFWNSAVLTNLDGVMDTVLDTLRIAAPAPTPALPKMGRETAGQPLPKKMTC